MTRKEQIENAAKKYATHWVDTNITDFHGKYEQKLDFVLPEHNAFLAGAEWADANPKSPWISVENDLPCNHDSMIREVCKGVDYETNRVLVLLIDGAIEISYMYRWMPHAWRWNTCEVTHWMPLPEY